MKAYKGFHRNEDGTLSCLDFTYEVGKTATAYFKALADQDGKAEVVDAETAQTDNNENSGSEAK